MTYRSKSALFLMEQLIVIAVFAICAAACVKIFVVSYITVSDSKDLTQALLAAESGAECFKSVAGDAAKTAALLEGSAGGDTVSVYYDEAWQTCGEEYAAYIMRLAIQYPTEATAAPVFADISVEKMSGEEIIAFTAAAGWKRNE